MKLFTRNVHALFFFVFLFSLTLASFWRVLFFGMWVDDTQLLWGSLHNLSLTYWYYNHPGLPLEFLLLSHLFGTQYVWWEVCNILLKALVAYFVGVFLYHLTQSKEAGIGAAVMFAVSYIGLEVVDAPIMNVAGLAAIPLLVSLTYFLTFIRRKQNGKKFLLSLLMAFFLDPGRIFSAFLLLSLLFFLVKKTKQKFSLQKRTLLGWSCLLAILTGVFALWFVCFEPNAQITKGIVGLLTHAPQFIGKLNRIGNLFGAVGNIFIGYFYSMQQDFQDTGYYSRIFGVVGLVFFFIGLASFILFLLQKERKVLGIIGFFILWMYAFYLPNWFSEPRAPMAGPHRYLFLSSIGFICLLAYLFSLFKKRWYFFLLTLIVVVANIIKANSVLAWQSSYRSQVILDRLWSVVNYEVPANEARDIFLFTGAQPWLSQSLQLFGGDRYALLRGYTSQKSFPLFVNDRREAILAVCQRQFALSHVYAWEVKKPGILQSQTAQLRATIQNTCKTKNHQYN